MNKNLLITEPDFSPVPSQIQTLRKSVENKSSRPQTLADNCFLRLTLPGDFMHLSYYTSSWGQEFMRQEKDITEGFSFENTRGRCSAQSAPFFTLSSRELSLDFAVCTSGNYRITLEPYESRMLLTVSDPNPEFETVLLPCQTFLFPAVLVHTFASSSLTDCYRQKQLYRKEHMLSHPVYETLPVIYNHWWAYEDQHVNEDIILDNARLAKEIGAELLVLDAGWFGNDSLTEEWFSVRGDWELVNHARFPHGLRRLREQIENMGLKFGIWCEIEGLGMQSRLLKEHPEYAATREGKNLGYVCFAYKEVQEWAYQTLHRLLSECGSTYLKMDFNLDPQAGCDSLRHGHGRHDGLHAHYQGLYSVLNRLRCEFPDLIIENCSSGGQRLNLEMAEHTHVHFLSDPDYSAHQMRIFKEAGKWLLPRQLLHFMWSNTVTTNGSAPFPALDPNLCSRDELAYHMRLAMMHPFGISHRLPSCSRRTLELMKELLTFYKVTIRPFIARGDYLPLYLSDHTNIFSFSMGEQVLFFLFAEEPDSITWDPSPVLEASHSWQLTDPDTGMKKLLPAGPAAPLSFKAPKKWSSQLLIAEKKSFLSTPGDA